MLRKKMSIMIPLVVALVILSIGSVYASGTINDHIQGIVYENAVPKAGVKVEVYRESTGQLDGYEVVFPERTQGELGTDYTDSNGKYHISWLYASNEWYIVKVYTPCGVIEARVQVPDGGKWFPVCYTCEPPPEDHVPTIGYWRHEINSWLDPDRPGVGAKEDYLDLINWCSSPEVAALIGDPSGNGVTDIYDCQMIYNSKNRADKDKWQPLTDILNELAGYI